MATVLQLILSGQTMDMKFSSIVSHFVPSEQGAKHFHHLQSYLQSVFPI